MNNHHSLCIQSVPIFNHLDLETLQLISKKVNHRIYKKDEYIYQPEDDTDVLFIVHTGAVRIYQIVESGKEQLVRILGPGDFSGEWSIFNLGSIHNNYAQVIKQATVCLIYKKDFQNFLIEYPKIALKLLGEMSMRLAQSEKQTTTVSTDQVIQRIIRYLADQAKPEQELNFVVELPLSRKDLASYLGTSPETISRKFKELESLNLIQQLSPRRIKIFSLDKLLYSQNCEN